MRAITAFLRNYETPTNEPMELVVISNFSLWGGSNSGPIDAKLHPLNHSITQKLQYFEFNKLFKELIYKL